MSVKNRHLFISIHPAIDMDLDSVIEKRHSARTFKNKKASWKSVLEAIDAAIKAPFADNRCHLKFLIIEDKKTIDKIAEFAKQLWINQSSILVLICSDDSNLENMHGERGRVYSRQQSGAAIENFLLKITDLGLSACWIGSYSDELIKELLKIPHHIQIEAIIPIGYEPGSSKRKRKPALENHLFWETWDQSKRPALFREGPETDVV